MGKMRQGGFVFEWWIGDHPPRHIHVSLPDGRLLGRVALEDLSPLDPWTPPRKVLTIIEKLRKEGRV